MTPRRLPWRRRLALALALALATTAVLTVPAAANATTTKNPVVLVTGLSGVAFEYESLAGRLRYDGYRVFIFQLPDLGFGDIRDSARALGAYIGQLKAGYGFTKLDLVGHSEGGLVSRYYLKFLGGTTSVDRYVSLGTPQYGTYLANILAFLGLGDCLAIIACQQMTIGSTFLSQLNYGDDTPGVVRYTTVRTLQDELVRPAYNATLADGATNVLVQEYCPVRVVGHVGLIYDGTVYTIVRSALADTGIRADCWAL